MDTLIVAPRTGFASHLLQLRTSFARQFIDITDDVKECISRSGLSNGLTIVASRHTTGAIVINEHLGFNDGVVERLGGMMLGDPPDGAFV